MINEYINKTLGKSNISKKEKLELNEQFLEHLLSLKEEYISNGYKEKEAELLAIKEFGDTSTISGLFNKNKEIRQSIKITSIALLIIYSPLFVLAFHNISRWDASAMRYSFKNLIPFSLIYKELFTKDISFSMVLTQPQTIPFLAHLLLAVFFIPIGLLTPIILNKTRMFLYNLKIYILITMLLQVSKLVLHLGRPHIDYIIIQSLCCLIGFVITKLAISIPIIKKYFYK